MPRLNNDRVVVTVWISRKGRDEVDEMARAQGVTRSDVLRAVFSAGLPIVKTYGPVKKSVMEGAK